MVLKTYYSYFCLLFKEKRPLCQKFSFASRVSSTAAEPPQEKERQSQQTGFVATCQEQRAVVSGIEESGKQQHLTGPR